MLHKLGTVIGGPSAWRGKTGQVLLEEDGYVVLLLTSKDDGGSNCYEVRMPATAVKFVEPTAASQVLN